MKLPKTPLRYASLATALLLSGCPCEREGQAPPEHRSPAATAMARHLETGGILHIAVDLQGDLAGLTGAIEEVAESLKQSNTGFSRNTGPLPAFLPILRATGLDGIAGFGLSSRKLDEHRFRNRAILHLDGPARGFLQLYSGANAPLRIARMAPASVDIVAEAALNFKSLHETVGAVAEATAGSMGRSGWTAAILTPIRGTPITVLDILNQLETRAYLAVDLDDAAPTVLNLPNGPLRLPSIHVFARIEGLADEVSRLQPLIVAEGLTVRETPTGIEVMLPFSPPPRSEGWDYLQPLIRVDTAANTVTFATSPAFADQFGQPGSALADSPAYQQTMTGLPVEGTSLVYISPETGPLLDRTFNSLIALTDPEESQTATVIWKLILPDLAHGEGSVSFQAPDGLVSVANSARSHKPTLFHASFYNPVMIGMYSAMVIPAFQKVRENARQKAILNNLRMVASAGQQYILENGESVVGYEKLEGEYFHPIQPVAGETYDHLVVRRQGGTLSVTLADGTTVEYTY